MNDTIELVTTPQECITALPWQPLPNGREVQVQVTDKGQPINRTPEGRDLPTLAVVFNQANGMAAVKFDTLDFPSWEWVSMVLHGALAYADAHIRTAQAVNLRNAMAHMEQDARLKHMVEEDLKAGKKVLASR